VHAFWLQDKSSGCNSAYIETAYLRKSRKVLRQKKEEEEEWVAEERCTVRLMSTFIAGRSEEIVEKERS
jgi:hypothetical protein